MPEKSAFFGWLTVRAAIRPTEIMVDLVSKERRHTNQAVLPRVIYHVYHNTVGLLDWLILTSPIDKTIYAFFLARSPSDHLREKEFRCLPRWGDHRLDHVKSVAVEEWLDSIKRAKGTKAKIRNIMSAIFHHAMRYKSVERNHSSSCVRARSERERPTFLN